MDMMGALIYLCPFLVLTAAVGNGRALPISTVLLEDLYHLSSVGAY